MKEPEKAGFLTAASDAAYDALWESFRQGDTEAFEDMFRQYYPVLLNYGMRITRNEAEAKDCVQSLFLQIWERRQFLGPTTSARNYLLASLRRSILKKIGGIRQVYTEDFPDFQAELSIETKLIQSQVEAENARLLKEAFDKLPARQKEAIFLRFYEDQDFDEIARIMNISTRAVYKLIYKGLDNLQSQLGKNNIDLAYLLVLLLIPVG
ncbi:MAG: hypothetical protein ABS46_17705 [Cytophagaceae bacterium SCN 52-12]|nr:MAG: hypothetical protein ABS46_17705 [Cytophagaceae bacterium SCN 52-12]